jgi:DNA-binding transcriptional LysR family regulator
VDLLQHMGTFVRIADAGSISKAARSMRLSVAMASRHLRALEEHLGVELVRRTTRHLSLTEAGTEFLARARALLAGLDEARDAVRPGKGAAGLLVVSLPVSFGLAQVGPLFPALLDKHPRLKLDLRFEDRFVDLLTDGVDIAIRAGARPPDSPFVVARKLATVDRLLCASPAFLAKYGAVRSIDALGRLPCVLQGPAPTHWTFESEDGPKVVEVCGRVRTNNVFSIREAVLAGSGIARLPLWIVDDDLKRRRLVQVLPHLTMPVIDIFGMFHTGSRGSTAIRATLDFLQEQLPRRTKMRPVVPESPKSPPAKPVRGRS